MAHRIADIDIHPELEALKALNLSQEDFYSALETALDQLDGQPTTALPRPRNISILVRGEQRRLGELARIAVSLKSPHESAPV